VVLPFHGFRCFSCSSWPFIIHSIPVSFVSALSSPPRMSLSCDRRRGIRDLERPSHMHPDSKIVTLSSQLTRTDQEKKKYFQIQADHAVPAGAKHSRSNVRHEKAATKKRKVTERFEKKRRTQTIRRSRILSIPEYGGIALVRECGGHSNTVNQAQADAAFASQLKPLSARFPGHSLLSAHPIPSLGRTLFTSCGYQNGDVGSPVYKVDAISGLTQGLRVMNSCSYLRLLANRLWRRYQSFSHTLGTSVGAMIDGGSLPMLDHKTRATRRHGQHFAQLV
jgi:hypothetical protein